MIRFNKVVVFLPILILILSLLMNIYYYSRSIKKIEEISFPSPNGNIVSAYLYYPRNPISTPCPVVIYAHGLKWSKDTDIRFPIDLAREGFMVISIDQEGHGKTTSTLYKENTLGPLFWKNIIGAIDYIYSRPDIFDKSKIGCCGYSLGGLATLMAIVTDSRISASVVLAGPSNLSRFPNETVFDLQFKLLKIPYDRDIFHNPEVRKTLSAVNYLKGLYPSVSPRSLLLIYGEKDAIVPPFHGQEVFDIINDTSKCQIEILPGADHSLINTDLNYCSIRVIQFFQEKLIGGSPESVKNIESELVFAKIYFFYFLSFCLLFYLLDMICFFTYKFTNKGNKRCEDRKDLESGIPKKVILNLILVSLPIFGVWFLLYLLQRILFLNFLEDFVIGGILFIIYSIFILFNKKRKFNRKDLKKIIIKEIDKKDVVIGLYLGVTLTISYYLLSSGFKIFLISPRSVHLYIMSLMVAVPIFGIELLIRKIFQDQLFIFKKFYKYLYYPIMVCLTIMLLCPILVLTRPYYYMTQFFGLSLIMVSIASIYIYEKSQKLITAVLLQTIFLSYILGNSYYLFM